MKSSPFPPLGAACELKQLSPCLQWSGPRQLLPTLGLLHPTSKPGRGHSQAKLHFSTNCAASSFSGFRRLLLRISSSFTLPPLSWRKTHRSGTGRAARPAGRKGAGETLRRKGARVWGRSRQPPGPATVKLQSLSRGGIRWADLALCEPDGCDVALEVTKAQVSPRPRREAGAAGEPRRSSSSVLTSPLLPGTWCCFANQLFQSSNLQRPYAPSAAEKFRSGFHIFYTVAVGLVLALGSTLFYPALRFSSLCLYSAMDWAAVSCTIPSGMASQICKATPRRTPPPPCCLYAGFMVGIVHLCVVWGTAVLCCDLTALPVEWLEF